MKEKFMSTALEQAKLAIEANEIPIGAIVVRDNEIIAAGYNLRETNKSVSSHAEINALQSAAKAIGTWKLDDCELYVTVEPCLMCYGAIVQSRIKKVYIGSKQLSFKKTTYRYYIENPELEIEEVLMDECKVLMQEFFKKMRKGRSNVRY